MRTFSLFIHHQDADTPILLMEVADDLGTVRSMAKQALADSPRRLVVEVREEDRLIFSLDRNGVSWAAHPD